MNWKTVTLALSVFGCTYFSPAHANTKLLTPKQTKQLLAKVKQWAKGIKTYKLETETHVKVGDKKSTMLGSSTIWGETHQFMRIDANIHHQRLKGERFKSFPTHTQMIVVYTKRWQWIHTKSYRDKKLLRQQLMKVDRTKLRVPGRPFDTSYNTRGLGISEGQDFPASILQLVRLYRVGQATYVEKKGEKPSYLLPGTLRKKAFRDYLMQTGNRYLSPTLQERTLKILSKMIERSVFQLDAKTFLPQKFIQLSDPSEKKRKMEGFIRYKNIRVNQKLSSKLFQFQPPKGVKVKDLTGPLVQRRNQMKKQATPPKQPSKRNKPIQR